ncbi:hypothetical protein [Streptomyces sp. NK15101]|uniref:hypothetical protein n=1 Tax=Streptomyces sp. NK15101 TaxID=2873261 RepID=UPI001CED5B49|nr:hypothetical protein [Streptomyces sp. NK15101]
MTKLDDILSRALLVQDRAAPRDTVPPREPEPTVHPPVTPGQMPAASAAAAEDLRALCEALVRHTPATAVSAFVTDQVPEPRSALVLACVLQLTDTDDAARFWWQYAAGAGQPGAAYCLYLHHLALGETHTARWWHTQTHEDKPPARHAWTTVHWNNKPLVLRHEDHASTTTIVRVLRNLAQHVSRPRSAVVTELMKYMPTAVAVGYLREPESELPLPGPSFAREVQALLDEAIDRLDHPADRPGPPGDRPAPRRNTGHRVPAARETDEAATR